MNRLKEIRKKRCMSQADLAKLAGITTATIIDIEHGKRNPKFVTIRALAVALNVETSEFNFD